MKELLTVEHLYVEHIKTKKQLVGDVCFSICPGHSLVVLGQSGCGKTMTCHSIMGLLDPKRFRVTGRTAFGKYRLRVGCSGHHCALLVPQCKRPDGSDLCGGYYAVCVRPVRPLIANENRIVCYEMKELLVRKTNVESIPVVDMLRVEKTEHERQ